MNIKIKSTNVSMGPAVEEYVFKKMQSLDKFMKNVDSVLCEIELAKNTKHHKSVDLYKAEANIGYDGRQVYVYSEKDDLYAAIDEMRDEAERTIISRRKRYLSMVRKGSKKVKELIRKIYE